MFLIYVLIVCLGHEQPVALEMLPGFYLLFRGGPPTVHASRDVEALEDLPDIWLLSNASNRVIEPCDAFQLDEGFLLQASSPAERHWKGWTKEKNSQLYMMDASAKKSSHDMARSSIGKSCNALEIRIAQDKSR